MKPTEITTIRTIIANSVVKANLTADRDKRNDLIRKADEAVSSFITTLSK